MHGISILCNIYTTFKGIIYSSYLLFIVSAQKWKKMSAVATPTILTNLCSMQNLFSSRGANDLDSNRANINYASNKSAIKLHISNLKKVSVPVWCCTLWNQNYPNIISEEKCYGPMPHETIDLKTNSQSVFAWKTKKFNEASKHLRK